VGRIVQFIAGRKDTDTQSAHDRQFGGPGGGREAEVIVTQPASAREDQGATLQVLTTKANVGADRGAGTDVYVVAMHVHILLRHDGVSTDRECRASHDAHRLSLQDMAWKWMAGQRATCDAQS
jgi:hypothetical protein